MEKIEINTDWLGIDTPDKELFNPMEYVFHDNNIEEAQKRLAVIMMDPYYFHFVCKYIFNFELLPFQAVIIKELWEKKFPMLIGSRGSSKSTILAVYSMLRAFLIPKRKVIIVGAAFRQSKVVFQYMKEIWENAPILRSLCNTSSGDSTTPDMCTMTINRSTVKCLPLGDGERIRGQRAHDTLADEMASIPIDIFERVVGGFGTVAQNPVEKVKQASLKKLKKKQTYDNLLEYENQLVMSGTAYYSFNHFCRYWENYKRWIDTKGNEKKIAELIKNNDKENNSNWENYSIIRLPVDILPEGLMDAGMIARIKATVHAGISLMELSSCFSKDSYGFFKRTLIESCVVSNKNTIKLASGEVMFEASLRGRPGATHVFGIDPAADQDNFSIVVLEVNPDHRRIVHCWTTNRKRHREKLEKKVAQDADYYRYCARKIRDLMKLFPCTEIALDTQGGGVSIEEALHDSANLLEGEIPIWPTIDPDKEKPTDDKPGLHILKKCVFAKAEWLSEANHGMRKDFEDKILLFPFFDSVSLELSYQQDDIEKRTYDNLEDCVLNIEDLKDELSSIVITTTPSGRERWDTPETKTDVGKKVSQHKDRYSALLMANMSARTKPNTNPFDNYVGTGGIAQPMKPEDLYPETNELIGPDWWTSSMKGFVYE